MTIDLSNAMFVNILTINKRGKKLKIVAFCALKAFYDEN
jgi:hypothetical protein